MPNWCYNNLTLQVQDDQKAEEFEAFLKTLSEADEDATSGLFTYFLPIPDDKESDWYSWRIENWGTKWDVTTPEWERIEDNTFVLSFDTAWGPPTSLYESIYERDDEWEVTAYYSETGMGFVGKFEDGFNELYSYDFEDENWRDDIPEELVEFGGLDYDYDYYLESIEEDEDE